MSTPGQRVCPRCGAPAGTQPFCATCGLNLSQLPELPSAEEYAARLREEQWLRHQAAPAPPTGAGSFGVASRARSEPSIGSASRVSPLASRDRLIGWAGWIGVGCAALVVIGAMLGAISSVIKQNVFGFRVPVYAALAVSNWIAFLSAILILAAAFYVARAFLGPAQARAERLFNAAWLLAGAYLGGFISEGTLAGFLIGHHALGSESASVVVVAVAAAAAAVAFGVAATGFRIASPQHNPRRDGRLGNGAILLAVSGGFVVVAGILALVAHAGVIGGAVGGFGSSTAASVLSLIGGLITVAAAIVLAVALSRSASGQRQGRIAWWVQRDRFIAGSVMALAFATLLGAIGLMALAGQGGLISEFATGLAKAGAWLVAVGELLFVGAIGCVAAGFFISGWQRD